MKNLVLALALVATGSFATAQQTLSQNTKNPAVDLQQKRDQMQRKNLADMQRDLGLNQTQVDKIQALRDQERANRKANFESKKADRKAAQDAHIAAMKNILTPEQYAKWESIKQAKRDERKNNKKGKDKMSLQTVN